jgi:hypothetical protein
MAALDKTHKEAQRLIQILAKQDRGGCGLPPPHGALRNGLASAHKYFRNFLLDTLANLWQNRRRRKNTHPKKQQNTLETKKGSQP